MNRSRWFALGAGILFMTVCSGCIFSKIPVKQYYVLNYIPSTKRDRQYPAPYPATIRLKDFSIEEAYNRPQIVYRQSPFELQYYTFRVWAVKPAGMVTDMAYKHLLASTLVSNIIRRFDEGPRADFELSGNIEAIEEYDSEELWFAHLAIRFSLVRLSNGQSVYTRRFDLRKRVFEHKPESVVRELSSLMELIMTQAVHDMDLKLGREFGRISGADTLQSGTAASEENGVPGEIP